MPYKSEHTARQTDPEQFKDLRRVHEEVAPDGIDFIYGIKGDDTIEIQSVRADASLWSVEDFVSWLEEHDLAAYSVEPAAKQQAEPEEMAKGDASTPAKPEEQIKGSDKNEPKSAAGKRGGIELDEPTETGLMNKAQAHNEDVKGDLTKRTDIGVLKAVYRRGAGAFSAGHRPGMTRGQWSMGRVNAFLYLLKEGKPKNPKYTTDNDLLPAGHPRANRKDDEASRELGRMVRLPVYVRDALRKGLTLHEAGRSGQGLREVTVRMATIGAQSGEWSDEKIIKAAAWFERHESDRKLKGGRRWNVKGAETPGFVAWLLWGSDANDRGRAWLRNKSEELKEGGQMSQPEQEQAVELGWNEGEKDTAFEPKPGDPLAEYRDPNGILTPMITKDDIDPEREKDLHVMRLGPLYDLETGEMVLNLTEEGAREISRTTQRMIEAGHFVPISFEHGIEGGQRGQDGSDRRPYGQIDGVYYDEQRRGIYARKAWTKLGMGLLVAAMTGDGKTAMRISPRVKMRPAYHPATGERLGESYMDVVSLTTLPRQDSMEAVALSRATVTTEREETKMEALEVLTTAGESVIIEESKEMTETIEKTVDVLLTRDSEEARSIYKAAGLDEGAPVLELARRFETVSAELSRTTEELKKYQSEELARFTAEKEAEVDAFLTGHDVLDTEREFFRLSLLSDNEKTAELARQTIIARGAPDKLAPVEEALTEAKKRGAVPADFIVDGELAELSRTAPGVAAGIINAIPGENVVRVGNAVGSDVAGVETESTIDKEEAGVELSRIARKLVTEGKASSLLEGHKMAKIERPDLVNATKEK